MEYIGATKSVFASPQKKNSVDDFNLEPYFSQLKEYNKNLGIQFQTKLRLLYNS